MKLRRHLLAVGVALALAPRGDGVLQASYESEDDIPEAYRDLFTERNGAWELTRVQGLRGAGDVQRLEQSLRRERDDHKATRAKLREYEQLEQEPAELRALLDRLPELEAAADDHKDVEAKIEARVQARANAQIAKMERERDQAIKDRDEAREQNTQLTAQARERRIADAVRKAAVKKKVQAPAMEDALLLASRVLTEDDDGNIVTRDSVGVTPGLDPETWLEEIAPNRPHWFEGSGGGGGRGGDGRGGGANNPFSKEAWNVTEQGRLMQANPQRADQLAQAAGFKSAAKAPTRPPA